VRKKSEMITENAGITRCCVHREAVNCLWITRNEGEGAPILFISGSEAPIVVTLTNQTFYVKCPECFRGVYPADKKMLA
jgi:hypothetical protein